jgi:streptogramin lyase
MIKRCIALASIAALAACGGQSTSFTPAATAQPAASSSPGSSTQSSDSVTFTIAVPSASAPASNRRRAYTSSNTGSIGITLVSVNGVAQSASATIVALGASASGCTSASSGVNCSVTVTAPAGDDLFSIATYQSNNGTGAVLASTSIAADVGTTSSTVALTLSGVPAAVSFTPARLPLLDNETVQSVPVVVNAADASGATIVGSAPYQSPVNLQIQNDPAGALALSTTSVATPGTVVTVTYNSLKTLIDGSIVASDNGMKTATLIAAPLVVNPDPVTIFDDTASSAVTLSEGGFTGSFTASIADASDAGVTVSSGTLGSGSAVATIVPKTHFDVTALAVNDGSMTVDVPVSIIPQNGTYTAFGQSASTHTLISPTNMVEGPGGMLWTGDSGTGNLDEFNPSTGTFTSYQVDPTLQGPLGIAFDANGNIWFADGPQIGEFTPSTQAVTDYTTGLESNAWITDIIAGPSGTMWFYDQGSYASNVNSSGTYFGSISTANGTIAEYPAPGKAGPDIAPGNTLSGMSMALASDGSIWFADAYNTAVGHINTSTGAMTETQIGTPAYPQQSPMQVAIVNGKVWFLAEGFTSATAVAGSIATSNNDAITYYPVPNPGQFIALTLGSDGNLWFVDAPGGLFHSSQTYLGVLNPATGAVYDYTTVIPVNAVVLSLVDRGDRTLWMLDSAYGDIGEVTFK